MLLAGKINPSRDFVGGPKLENNKFKMADGRHLGNTQGDVSHPVLGRFAPNLVCCFILVKFGRRIDIGHMRLLWSKIQLSIKFKMAAMAVAAILKIHTQ